MLKHSLQNTNVLRHCRFCSSIDMHTETLTNVHTLSCGIINAKEATHQHPAKQVVIKLHPLSIMKNAASFADDFIDDLY